MAPSWRSTSSSKSGSGFDQRSGEGYPVVRARVTRFFDRLAAVYDTSILQRYVYRPNHDAVMAVLRQVNPRGVADVGCGTGVLTVRIADELDIGPVFGCDPSTGLLSNAKTKSNGVHWHQAPAEYLPITDDGVDAVVSTEAFHFFDQPKALAEFQRVLRPGGYLVIASFNLYPAIARLRGARYRSASLTTAAVLADRIGASGFDVVGQWPIRRFTRIWVATTLTLARWSVD